MLRIKSEAYLCWAIAKSLGVTSGRAAELFDKHLMPFAEKIGGYQDIYGGALHFNPEPTGKKYRAKKLRILRMAIKAKENENT